MRWLVLIATFFGLSPAISAAEAVPDQVLVAGVLPCAEPWTGRAHGWRQLAWELMKRTSVEAELEWRPVDPASSELFRRPLLFWSCRGEVASLSDEAVGKLRRFLTLGGSLIIDDPSAQADGPFDRSVRAALARLFPDRRLAPIPPDHVLFKSFFLTGSDAGRVLTSPSLLGLEVGRRMAVIYSQNDLLGALSRDLYGSWEFVIEPGGDRQRERSFRLGINLIFYALCLDYKNDRVHLPFILKRRRL